MEHLPIYRSSTRRTGATLLQWRRTASWGAAAAALTLSGIALGYQGFSEPSTDQSSVVVAGVTVPAPMVTLPLTDGGHPDIITTLSAALIAHVQAAPPAVQLLLFGPLGPLLGPQPVAMTVEPVDFLLVDEPIPVMLEEVPVEEDAVVVTEDTLAVSEETMVEPAVTQLIAAAAPVRTFSFATVAIAAPDGGPQQVQSAVEAAPPPDVPAPPPPAPAANEVAPVKAQTVAHVAPQPVVRPEVAQPEKAAPTPPREKPAQEAKHPVPPAVVEKKNGNDNNDNSGGGGKGNGNGKNNGNGNNGKDKDKGDSSNHGD
jgi:hypothetical protein